MRQLTFTSLLTLFVLAALLTIHGCKSSSDEVTTTSTAAKTYDAQVPLQWYKLFLDIDRYSQGFRPPAAARLLAYVGLAAYESAVPGMPEYNSLEYSFPGLSLPSVEPGKEYHWPTAVNAAYSTMFQDFYTNIKAADVYKIATLESKFYDEFGATVKPDVLERSRQFGIEVAEAVYKYSESDTYGHNANNNPRPANYVPPKIGPNGEKLWQPTFPDYTAALFPYWGKVRPFAMTQSDLIAKAPLPYSENPNSMFYQQANEVRLWVDNASFNDYWISQFWSDDFFELTFEPAGRQIAIANILVESDHISLDRAVELYAKMGMSM
ncbi:MAG TPA: hypothetical protein VJ508_07725, partial [Saprospiraceae bacterium]|nr:hypothetical protein [Saprospiraceae bacterium]